MKIVSWNVAGLRTCLNREFEIFLLIRIIKKRMLLVFIRMKTQENMLYIKIKILAKEQLDMKEQMKNMRLMNYI